jgi:hypothetical protein
LNGNSVNTVKFKGIEINKMKIRFSMRRGTVGSIMGKGRDSLAKVPDKGVSADFGR